MKFRTEYKPVRSPFTLSPDRRIIMLGSCFADNMRMRMRDCLWDVDNPLGTLYNPLSIERSLRICLADAGGEERFRETLFQDARGICHSWLFDSGMSAVSVQQCESCFGAVSERVRRGVEEAEAMFVTFGTSHCYFLAGKSGYVVANCHKQPSVMFERRRLSIEEIVDVWERLASDLRRLNPSLRIIFTVSPVRHIKDGLEGNARSKAVLLLAVDELCRRLDCCSYFPAYEIVNDDLRDYRFYAGDLVHPSDQAVEYLWEIFRATYVDKAGESLLKEGESIVRALHHRPLIGGDEGTAEWLRQAHARLDGFLSRHPTMLDIRE